MAKEKKDIAQPAEAQAGEESGKKAKGKPSAETKKTGTGVYSHGCKSEYQDSVYGKGMRLMNHGKEKARCTVCGQKKE